MSDITCHFSNTLAPEDLERFDAFVQQSRSGTVCQRPNWVNVVKPSRLQRYAYVWCRREKQMLLAGLLRLTRLAPGRYLGTFRRGPVVQQLEDFAIVLPALQARLRDAGICTLMMEPHWEGELAMALERLLEKQGFRRLNGHDTSMWPTTGIVDLRPDEKSVFTGFRRTCRQDIQRSQRDGLIIRPAHSEHDIAEFARIYRKMATIRGLEIFGQPDLLALWRVFGTTGAVFLIAEYENNVIGGMVSVKEGKRGYALVLASDPDVTQRIDRSGPLYWESMRHMKLQGCDHFDLGGMSDPNAQREGGDKGNQRDRYKAKFRPRIETLAPTMVAALHPISHYALFGLRQSYRLSRLPQIIGPLLQR